MRRILFLVASLALVAAACGSDSTDTTEGSGSEEQTTTTSATATTTTAAPATTTTAAPATTTTAAAIVNPILATPVVGVLQPYNEAGAALFPTGSVEAHWYQWDGQYVVLYRGFDASTGDPMCPGNSVLVGADFGNISNSPINGTADEVCIGSPSIAEAPDGAYVCDSLLYYVTVIPAETAGTLYGTLELGTGDWAGQTSAVLTDLAATPEFEPGLDEYTLAASNVDDGGAVPCG